ncbi:uncharacterized protein LOC126909023 [Daktulosphaira vitifoliae]|uniref:uncharacterized protein LOC126909023 n=1 Tax=Daktulosphaira vitifoliae TaxID=58002 RepID=UPI0021AA0B84|nr:uncharacterized protein LOC126909023 [Daktulosphaira vitifoliae]
MQFIIISVLKAANKIDANSMDVQVVTVYPGDIESWIDRFSEDIEFEDISQNNKTIGTGIEHMYHSNQSKTNSDCVKISRAKKVQLIFSENINEFIKQNSNSIYDVFENAITTHTAVKTSLDLVTTYEKIILSNNNVNTPVITQTLSISPFILTPSSSIPEWVTTIIYLLQKKSEEVETQGSGWVFRGVVFLDINTFTYDPLRDGNEKADLVAREAVNNPLTEIRTYSSLIDIHRNVSTFCTNVWESEWRRTPNNKLREIKNTTEYWPKPHTSNRKDEVVINRLRIDHSKMSHGHLMCREDPAMCQTCGEPLTVKHLLIQCRDHVDARKRLEMPDNLFEALSPTHDNTIKIIAFLKQIDM